MGKGNIIKNSYNAEQACLTWFHVNYKGPLTISVPRTGRHNEETKAVSFGGFLFQTYKILRVKKGGSQAFPHPWPTTAELFITACKISESFPELNYRLFWQIPAELVTWLASVTNMADLAGCWGWV